MTTELNVTIMPHAYVSADGQIIQLLFAGADSQQVRLTFAAGEFERFLSRVGSMLTDARNRRLSKGDHLEIHAVEAVASASAPVGGGKVILSIRGSNGIPQHFSLAPDASSVLRVEMRKAEASARNQSSQTRQ